MGRTRRPYLPGGVFHLAARTLGRERLFTAAMRTAALGVIARVTTGSGARLMAVAIMPTHLHLVVQQGREPVSRLMQPLLRRLAALLQRDRELEGPIFWRPYACQVCMDPSHARNAIVYTHLNPVRAGLCAEPAAYRWTSHGLYADPSEGRDGGWDPATRTLRDVIEPANALPLFATGPGRTVDDLRGDYRRYVEWRLAVDRRRDNDEATAGPDSSSDVPWDPAWASLQWAKTLSPLFHAPATGADDALASQPPRHVPDLYDIARSVLATHAPALSLASVKGRGGSAEHSRARHELIRAMAAAGHRNVQIARFLGVSESAVSKVLRARPAKSS